MPRSGAVPRVVSPPTTPPRTAAPEGSSLCQRVSRMVSRFFNCLANLFCCCFRERERNISIHRIPDPVPQRVTTPPSSYPPPHSTPPHRTTPPPHSTPPHRTTPPESSSSSSSSLPDLPHPSDHLDEIPPLPSVEKGIWLPSGELTVAKDADNNPIDHVLMYRDEIEKLMEKKPHLEVATPSHCYHISIPKDGTLLIVRQQNGLELSSWRAKLTEKTMDETEVPACLIRINGKTPSEGASEILSELQQIADAIEALNSQYDQTVRIQGELHQLDPKLLSLLSNLVHKKCYTERRAPGYYGYQAPPVQVHYQIHSVRFAIPVTEQNGRTTSKTVTVELSTEAASSQHSVPRRKIVFRTEDPPREQLSLLFDNEGNLHEVSLSPSSKFFTTDEQGSISMPRLQMLLIRLLTTEGMNVSGGQVSLHPIVIKLNPFAVLSQLSTAGDTFNVNTVRFLNDLFEHSGTVDAGGPRRQFIGDLSYYFLGGNPRAKIPLAMAYGVPKIRADASEEDIVNACQYLARLITYCHNTTGPGGEDRPMVMGRVLKDIFFAMIHHMTVLGITEEDFTQKDTLLFHIYDMFALFLVNLLPKKGLSIDPDGEDYALDGEDKSVKVDRQTIIDTVAHYSSSAALVDSEENHFADQCKIIAKAFTGGAIDSSSGDFNPKEALDVALIDQFGPIVRAVQQVAKHLPRNVTQTLQELYDNNPSETAMALYSERVQGARFDPEAIAQRVVAANYHNREGLHEKCAWIQEFIRTPDYYDQSIAILPEKEREEAAKTSHKQWVKNLVKFATGSSTLPNGMDITIIPAAQGKNLCEGHTCSATLEVPRHHPRVGSAKGLAIDNKRAFFLNLHYSMANGHTFTTS